VLLSAIQNHIISQLKNADSLRYRDIKPVEVPNDLYNYHLQTLVSKGLIDKHDDGYSLSEAGREYVADIHHTSDQSNRLFKVNVITVVSRVHNDRLQVLVQERMSQPSYGIIGVMGGTILKGESMTDGARRKLQQETGLSAEFKVLGIERRHLYKNRDLFSDVLFPICYATEHSGELQEMTAFGRNFWMDIGEAIALNERPYDSIASITKVLRAIQSGEVGNLPFFYEETVQSDI
jgi:ADP-ribose pyrophosphatase YjhB (NUDIX family)